MIRVVFDTNVAISGILWSGTPHLVWQAAFNGEIRPLASEVLLDELKDVIERPNFAERLRLLGKTASQIVEDYAALVEVIETEPIEPTVRADADDDHVLACALTGRANYIISGDPHLLEVQRYKNIPIVTASEFFALLASKGDEKPAADDA